MEHEGVYIKICRGSPKQLDQTMQKLGHILKHTGVQTLINYRNNIPCKTKEKQVKKKKLMQYPANNRTRMKYPKYRSKGLLIGSGTIESAHHTVLQKRMKPSGQRWSKSGIKNMINLRCIKYEWLLERSN